MHFMHEIENNNHIEQQLDALLTLQKQLNILLKEEQYEDFLQQQIILSQQIKEFMDSHSPDSLTQVLNKLRRLEEKTTALTIQAESHFKQLKDKSLLQQRNKNRLKAYK